MYAFYNKFVRPEENTLKVCSELVSALNVKITKSSLKEALETHPDYPSMLSMSDVLSRYNVPNFAIRLPFSQLKELEAPFVVLINDNSSIGNSYCLIKKTDANGVTIISPVTGNVERLAWGALEHAYGGISFVAESTEASGEKEYEKVLTKEKKNRRMVDMSLFFIPIVVIFSIIYSLITDGMLLPLFYVFCSLIGWLLSILLLWYEIDNNNAALKEVCGRTRQSQRSNCEAVLKSEAASIFGLSWSSLGFTYFSALLVMQMVIGLADTKALYIASICTTLAAFFIPFSLIYQWKLVKQWCVLCLSVQGVLSLQLIIVLIADWYPLTYNSISNLPFKEFVLLLISALFFFMLAYQLQPVLRRSKKLEKTNQELRKFKLNSDIFKFVLSRQKEIAPSGDLGIMLGNPSSKNKIIKVCNPYCDPCAKAHFVIEKLLEDNQDVSVQIIFATGKGDNDARALPVSHLLTIAQNGSESQTIKAMNYWYGMKTKDYEVFAGKYPLDEELRSQKSKLSQMHEWCSEMKINFTPTFFINGYQLPAEYTINDIQYLLKS